MDAKPTVGMFTDYFEAAMKRGNYEWWEEEGHFYAEIPGLQGIWATGKTLEECRSDLRGALESWVLLGLVLHHELPIVDGHELPSRAELEGAEAEVA